jgi:hypothetical protein
MLMRWKKAFGADVDCGQIVKLYDAESIGPGRYVPLASLARKRPLSLEAPDQRHISTSHVERQNLTMRMQLRRFNRLTNSFSKKVEKLRAAVGLHFAYYNFVRQHETLRVTPAMAAGFLIGCGHLRNWRSRPSDRKEWSLLQTILQTGLSMAKFKLPETVPTYAFPWDNGPATGPR